MYGDISTISFFEQTLLLFNEAHYSFRHQCLQRLLALWEDLEATSGMHFSHKLCCSAADPGIDPPPIFLRGIKDARTGFHLRNEKASGLLLQRKCGSRAKSMVELSSASKSCMPSKSVAISVRG